MYMLNKSVKSCMAIGLAICLMVQGIYGAVGKATTPIPSEPAINSGSAIKEVQDSKEPGSEVDNSSGVVLDGADIQYPAIVPWLELAAKSVLLSVSFDQLVGALQQPLINVDGCLMLLDLAKNNVLLVKSEALKSDELKTDEIETDELETDEADSQDQQNGSLQKALEGASKVLESRSGYNAIKSGVIYSSNLPYRVYWLYLNRGVEWAPEWLFVLLDKQGQIVRMAARTGDGRIVPATTASRGLDFLERYVTYRAKNGAMAQKDVIRAVQLNMDRGFYERVQEIAKSDAGALLVLVNKFYRLPKGYAPADLVAVDARYARNGWRYELRSDAYAAFVKMRKAAEAEGLRLVVASAYRSYGTQGNVYADYVTGSGKVAAEQYSARPGHSEHQTGLAMDIRSGSSEGSFVGSREFKWLVANGHRYGFVLRYPKGKTSITGYAYEPWHWRYVGVEAAKAMKASGLTLEEYLIYK